MIPVVSTGLHCGLETQKLNTAKVARVIPVVSTGLHCGVVMTAEDMRGLRE